MTHWLPTTSVKFIITRPPLNMLALQLIQFQSKTPMFNAQTKKQIRFNRGKQIIVSRTPVTVVDQHTIQWREDIALTQAYDEDVSFEIRNLHQFGYNPEEIESIVYGTVQFHKYQKEGRFLAYMHVKKETNVGTLTIKYDKLDEGEKIRTEILVRELTKAPARGYLTLSNGTKTLMSKMVEPVKGEFFFEMKLREGYLPQAPDEWVQVSFMSQSKQAVGTAKINYSNDGKISKQVLLGPDNKQVGKIYFDMAPQGRPKVKNITTQLNSMHSLSRLRSSSVSQLTSDPFNTLGTTRVKRMSVVHKNSDVVFPKEQRFKLPQKSPVLSYSKLPSMAYEQHKNQKVYRGASLGLGSKVDFAKAFKNNPGVGQYKLPSIFDRY